MSNAATDTATPAPGAEQTTAGNYFVSNYPPFSVWKEESIGQAYDKLEQAPRGDVPLGIYVHIPFCRKRCHFCYFKVYTDKNSTEIQRYTGAMIEELKHYAKKPILGGRKADFVYFGGGTPSYLGSDQLRQLTDEMKKLVSWDGVQEVAFECEPGTLTEHKLKQIKDVGVTRLSLGIENFDDHILEINGRAHRGGEIDRAYGYARELGFAQINIDLIAGMVEETEENWRRCVEKTIALAPDSVTIYQMEIPFNTTIYKQMREAGKLVAPVADWPTKRRWVSYAFDELQKAGYGIGSAYTAVKDKQKTKFVYRDRLWEGADLLGIGVASFGHVNGTHFQNRPDFESYIAAVGKGELPLWRAYTPTEDERFIREWVLQLKLGQVQRAYFRDKFGEDPGVRFAEMITTYEADGYFETEGDEVRVTRKGLLEIDRLLHGFFLPRHRNIRYT